MAVGCLDILFFGGLSWLFEKSHQAKNKELDQVEIGTNTWMGMSGKTRYNRRYLGPIQTKTFLSTSKLMASKVMEYESILNKQLVGKHDPSSYQKDNDVSQLIVLNKKIIQYMRKIDRRESLRCYAEWKIDHPKSFLAYQQARDKAIELDSKLEEVKKLLL